MKRLFTSARRALAGMAGTLLLLSSPAQAQNTQLTVAQAAVVGATASVAVGRIGYNQAVADAQGNTGGIDPFTRSRTLNGYVARLHAGTGAWRWIVQTGGNGDEDLRAPQLDGAGHVLVAGGFADLLGLPGGSMFGPTRLQSPGGKDLVVAQLDTAGRWLWARQAGSATSGSGTALYGMGGQDRGLLFSSFMTTSMQLGPFSLLAYPGQSPGQEYTYFTAQLGANGPLAAQIAQKSAKFAVFPNPARTAVSVAGLPPGQAVQLLDVLGRTVLHGQVPLRGELHLALPAGLPTGFYLVRAGTQARRLVVE